jgi:hypothetical protein
MELCEAEAVGVLDNHDAGVGNVDADFNDGGGDEDVDFSSLKTAHDDLFEVSVEATVKKPDAETFKRTGSQVVVHLDGGFKWSARSGREKIG